MNNRICPDGCLNPPEPKAYCLCALCGEEIYVGTKFYNVNGDALCEDCIGVYMEQYVEIAGGDK